MDECFSNNKEATGLIFVCTYPNNMSDFQVWHSPVLGAVLTSLTALTSQFYPWPHSR